MKAIVLAGGYATRLRPISYALPKLLFPVLGKPMIYWTLDMLKGLGVEEVVLAVNYLADLLRSEVGSNYKGIDIIYSLEKSPLGTGGPIKLASQAMHFDETLIAMNGDVIANIDLEKMLEHHMKIKASITDALHKVRNPARFGSVEIDRGSHIRRFIEKPRSTRSASRLINAGVYMIEPEVLSMIPANRRVSLEREIFPLLAKDGKLFGFEFLGDWFDIGSLADYQKANFSLLKKSAKGTLSQRDKVRVNKGGIIKPPAILGEGSKVKNGASLGPNVVAGKSNLIQEKACVSDSILFDKVTIGPGSVVSGAILASGVVVGKGVRIESGSIISPHVEIRDGVRIGRKVIVHPHKEIESNIASGTHVM